MISSILVVCVGNVCRSPMAEGMLRDRLSSVRLQSAGIGALEGNPAEPHAVSLMAERGIDISSHRARQIDTSMCRETDLILVMDYTQKRVIEESFTFTCGRVFRLGNFGGFDVPDPYRRPREQFDICGELIDRGVSDWVNRIHAL